MSSSNDATRRKLTRIYRRKHRGRLVIQQFAGIAFKLMVEYAQRVLVPKPFPLTESEMGRFANRIYPIEYAEVEDRVHDAMQKKEES